MSVCVVNPNYLQKVALPTSAAQQSERMGSGKRQIFHADIGRAVAKLRDDRRLSQGQVAQRSKGKISEGTLKAIETGRIKNPDPDHLRTLAAIYGVPFRQIADPFIQANYGSDLTGQFGDQKLGSSSNVGDPKNVPAAVGVELEQLRELVSKYETEAREVRTATDAIVKVALRLEKIRKTEGAKPHRGGGHRKVG